MNIDINNRQDELHVPEQDLCKLAGHTLLYMGVPDCAELSLSFVDEQEIQKLNAEYRSTNTVTDVLSFPCDIENLEQLKTLVDRSAQQGVSQTMEYADVVELGDVVICPVVIDEQRHEFNTSFDEELSLMLVHSILHLLGFDHIKEKERKIMQQKEKEILESYGLAGLR